MLYNISDHIAQVRNEMLDGEVLHGLKSGFSKLDEFTGGLWNKELIVIGSRPSMGKTALALSLLEKTAVDDERTSVLFSLGNAAQQVMKRMIYQRAHVNWFSADRDNEERGYIIDAASELKNGRLFVDDTPAVSPEYIKGRCREIQQNQNIWLIVVDYLQLMHIDGFETRREMLNQVARDLKIIAIEYDCPVVLLSQLNRSVEARADHHPLLADIRDASELEEIADEVLFLYRDEYYNWDSEKRGIADLQIAKCSHGNVNTINIVYMPEYSVFGNIE